jgi:hypothetical protein
MALVAWRRSLSLLWFWHSVVGDYPRLGSQKHWLRLWTGPLAFQLSVWASVALMLRDAKEQIAKMKRFRLIGVALLAVFALSVVAASGAQAETAPFFSIGGARLAAGKTHNFDARAIAPFKLEGSGTVIECANLSTAEGVLLGSNAGEPGKDNEVVNFSGCKSTGNGTACHLAATKGGPEVSTITTNPLKSEQVENVESGHVGKKLYEELFPAKKSEGFVTLHFGGTCTIEEGVVAGQVVAQDLYDNGTVGQVELGQSAVEAKSWIVNFPSTPITSVWLISGSGGKEVATEQTLFGATSKQIGTALVLLASTKFVSEPNATWSPLP